MREITERESVAGERGGIVPSWPVPPGCANAAGASRRSSSLVAAEPSVPRTQAARPARPPARARIGLPRRHGRPPLHGPRPCRFHPRPGPGHAFAGYASARASGGVASAVGGARHPASLPPLFPPPSCGSRRRCGRRATGRSPPPHAGADAAPAPHARPAPAAARTGAPRDLGLDQAQGSPRAPVQRPSRWVQKAVIGLGVVALYFGARAEPVPRLLRCPRRRDRGAHPAHGRGTRRGRRPPASTARVSPRSTGRAGSNGRTFRSTRRNTRIASCGR